MADKTTTPTPVDAPAAVAPPDSATPAVATTPAATLDDLIALVATVQTTVQQANQQVVQWQTEKAVTPEALSVARGQFATLLNQLQRYQASFTKRAGGA